MLYVSPAFADIWGRTCASLYASPMLWLEAIHPDDRERVRHAAMTTQATGTYDEHFRIVRPDDSICWIRDRAFPVRNEAGEVYRIAEVAEDITERKRAGTERRESNRRFRETLENVDLIAMTLDKSGNVTFCNDFLLRLTGWKRERGHRQPVVRHIPPPSAAARKKLFLDTINAGSFHPPPKPDPDEDGQGAEDRLE